MGSGPSYTNIGGGKTDRQYHNDLDCGPYMDPSVIEITRKRMTAAQKIVMILIDEINRKIIRPGPTAEERECYEMSQELRDFTPQLEKLVEQILKIDG